MSNSYQACERYEAVELRVAHMDSWPTCRLQLPLALLVMWPTTLTPSPTSAWSVLSWNYEPNSRAVM